MASVTVFVDDAVLGDLPPVCVIDGVMTDDVLTFSQQMGDRSGLGVAWLLLLIGPLGWLGLIVISAFRRSGELLTVTLPFSEAAYRRRVKAERARLLASVVTVALLIAAFAAFVQQHHPIPRRGPGTGRRGLRRTVERNRRGRPCAEGDGPARPRRLPPLAHPPRRPRVVRPRRPRPVHRRAEPRAPVSGGRWMQSTAATRRRAIRSSRLDPRQWKLAADERRCVVSGAKTVLMFVGDRCGRAAQAVDFYADDDSGGAGRPRRPHHRPCRSPGR